MTIHRSSLLKFAACLTLCMGLSHCLSYDLSKPVTQQGNLLVQHKVAKLRVGMTQDEVQQILGHSLIESTFDPERLDYSYTIERRQQPMEVKYVRLTFKNHHLTNIEHQP
jgi:outer membrane protein assembly factor BamE